VDRLTVMLETALDKSGYMNPRTKASSEAKLRRLVRRMEPSARDVEVWLGMLRQILWKLDQK
jgi:tRNA C32,U32 (ribose-2'-O)-methylase TrmJ